MSTSLAVQPALRTSKTERSKAVPDRTIFGTTLDNYAKCWKLLSNQEVIKEATETYNRKSKWKSPYPPSQTIIEKAWEKRIQKQVEDNQFRVGSDSLKLNQRVETAPSSVNKLKNSFEDLELNRKSSSSRRAARQDPNKVVLYHNSASFSGKTDKPSSFGLPCDVIGGNRTTKNRPMSEPVRGRRPPGGAKKVRVPRFRLAPGTTNFMKTSSMKITETGAKDILHSKPINKIGLGDTLQYNYHAFQRRDTPKFYRDNGHVLLMGQKFTAKTTNQEENAPGGFYKANGPDRFINEDFRYVKDRSSEVTMTHRAPYCGRKEIVLQVKNGEEKEVSYEVPLNILHKYGEKNVSTALLQNEDEPLSHVSIECIHVHLNNTHSAVKLCKFAKAFEKETDMKHTALVPPRLDVKELNHPIDPPTTYFTNFGENLKYDKFEGNFENDSRVLHYIGLQITGGLHLYIK